MCVCLFRKLNVFGAKSSIIHPFSFRHLSRSKPQCQLVRMFLFPIMSSSCSWGILQRFQARWDISTPMCSRFAPTCLEYLCREASKGHPDQMPRSLQLASCNVREQWFDSELFPDVQTPQLFPLKMGKVVTSSVSMVPDVNPVAAVKLVYNFTDFSELQASSLLLNKRVIDDLVWTTQQYL